MAKLTKLKLNLAGVNQVMRSSGVQARLESEAKEIATRANAGLTDSKGYEARSYVQRYVAVARVGTSDMASRRHESKTSALLKALG